MHSLEKGTRLQEAGLYRRIGLCRAILKHHTTMDRRLLTYCGQNHTLEVASPEERWAIPYLKWMPLTRLKLAMLMRANGITHLSLLEGATIRYGNPQLPQR